MTRIVILALSKWAHFSWLPRGTRALSERAQADANAALLARFPQLIAVDAPPLMPPFAVLPRPACTKVLRMTAALAHAALLRRLISADAQRIFACRIAPHVLHAIQRDLYTRREQADESVTPNILDRADMTAAGLRLALRTLDDPAERALLQLRLPRAISERSLQFGECGVRVAVARGWVDTAFALLVR
ncbi:MAG TPA: hypothetical protein VL689_12290 [Paraburkholderia sp.]|jgi:hypothetical protein|nr:hypothetical protein [Paraburkholderia sp.]